MLTIIRQRLVLRHLGISSCTHASRIGGQVASVVYSKVDFVRSPHDALEEAWKAKQLGRRRVTGPRRDSFRIVRVGPFRNILGRQVYPQREAWFLFRRLGWRRPCYWKAMAAFVGRQIRLHNRAHSGVESREEEEERGGQGRQICKKQYVHSSFFQKVFMLLFTRLFEYAYTYYRLRRPTYGRAASGHKITHNCLVSAKASS